MFIFCIVGDVSSRYILTVGIAGLKEKRHIVFLDIARVPSRIIAPIKSPLAMNESTPQLHAQKVLSSILTPVNLINEKLYIRVVLLYNSLILSKMVHGPYIW